MLCSSAAISGIGALSAGLTVSCPMVWLLVFWLSGMRCSGLSSVSVI